MRSLALFIFLIGCSTIHAIGPDTNAGYETERGHLFSSNKILFYQDSTFIYFVAGPAIRFSCGKWKHSNKRNIVMLSSDLNRCSRKISSDTLFINVDGTMVEFKSSNELIINGRRFFKNKDDEKWRN